MHFPDMVATGILDLDEHFDGGGKPRGLKGSDISPLARITLMCQVIDVFNVSHGRGAALRELAKRRGTWFDPVMVDAFLAVESEVGFWQVLGSAEIEAVVLALEPAQMERLADEDYLDDIAAAFARVIDAKSPYVRPQRVCRSIACGLVGTGVSNLPPRHTATAVQIAFVA